MRPVVTTAARGTTTAVLCPSARFTRHVCGSGFFGQPPLAGHDPSLSPEVPEERPGQGWERAAEPAAQLTTTEPQRRSLRGRFSRTRRIGTCSPKHSWPWVELAVSDDETGRREGTARATPARRAARSRSPSPGHRAVHPGIDVRNRAGKRTADAGSNVHRATRSGVLPAPAAPVRVTTRPGPRRRARAPPVAHRVRPRVPRTGNPSPWQSSPVPVGDPSSPRPQA